MSVDLVQLGEDVGKAEATAEAALEVAEVAEVLAVVEGAQESHGCGDDCPCRAEARELRAMLVAFTEKHDQDMDVIADVLDALVGEEEASEAPEEAEEEEPAVESVSVEEEEHGERGESSADQSGAAGHDGTGEGVEHEAGSGEEKSAAPKEEKRRKPAASRGVLRFRRGR